MALADRLRTPRAAARIESVRAGLLFLASLGVLSAMANVRYPATEPAFWYLIPSTDVIAVCCLLTAVAWAGWRVPAPVRALSVCVLLLLRLIRFGDGVQGKYFGQTFNLYTDVPLIPDLVRFARSSLPWWKFDLYAALAVVALVAMCAASYYALAYIERYLANWRGIAVFAGVLCIAGASGGLVRANPEYQNLFSVGFVSSAIPRVRREVAFLLRAPGRRAEYLAKIAQTQGRLDHAPRDLAKLKGTSVLLFFVESYGQTVVDWPPYAEQIRPAYDVFETELGQRGFFMASSLLDSPTYGGHSWLAHVTMNTGVAASDEFQYGLLCDQRPQNIVTLFHDAGYRTVLAQPGTTRPSPKSEFYRFDERYYARDFDYRGPTFAWATMPDQFVIDFLHRREIAKPRPRPLFVEYVLVSSHAPWSEQTTVIDDWSKVGNGSVFWINPRKRYPIRWPALADAYDAYIQSILYDLEVLRRYLTTFIEDDALVVILGDHQPVEQVNGGSAAYGVPIHVMSRNKALVDAFVARGYAPGMWPSEKRPHAPMEAFFEDFIRDFSRPARAANQVAPQ